MSAKADRYLWVRNWERFQHYRDRNPLWIKDYLEVLSSDEYLELSLARRGILHGLWLEFASSRRRMRLNTATISRRLNGRVTMADLEALNKAGYIVFVDSKRLASCERAFIKALASRAPARSQEEEPEPETETGNSTSSRSEVRDEPEAQAPSPEFAAPRNGTLDVKTELLLARLLDWIGDDADARTHAVVRHNLSQASEAAITELQESMTTAKPRHRAKWVVGTLQQATARGKTQAAA